MPQRNRVAPLFIVVALTLAGSVGCKTSFKYGTGGVDRVDLGSSRGKVVFAGVLPGAGVAPDRSDKFYGRESGDVHREIERSVSRHLEAAAVTTTDRVFAVTPKSAAELRTVLEKAQSSGASRVFVIRPKGMGAYGKVSKPVKLIDDACLMLGAVGGIGIVPLCAWYSVPNRREIAWARVEGFLIEPKTSTIVWRSVVQQDYDSKATLWGFNPPGEIAPTFKGAVQGLVEELGKAARNGFVDSQVPGDAVRVVFPEGLAKNAS